MALRLVERGLIVAAALNLQRETRVVGSIPLQPALQRSLTHA